MFPTVQRSCKGGPCPIPKGPSTNPALGTGQALRGWWSNGADRYLGQYPEPLAHAASPRHAATGRE